jgi:hypothetical protein
MRPLLTVALVAAAFVLAFCPVATRAEDSDAVAQEKAALQEQIQVKTREIAKLEEASNASKDAGVVNPAVDAALMKGRKELEDLNKRLTELDGIQEEWKVTIDGGGYWSKAYFKRDQYTEAAHFRDALKKRPENFYEVEGPDHPDTSDKGWQVSYRVSKPLTMRKRFPSEEKAKEYGKGLEARGFRVIYEKVQKS